jgi:outer membrane protein assembly factor BamB
VRSALILESGILYVTLRRWNRACHRRGNGAGKWQFQAGGQIHSTPSLSGDSILFGCDDGKVYAVNRNSGKKTLEGSDRC